MSLIGKLVTDSVSLIHEVQAGVHEAEKEHHIAKIEKQLDKVKQTIHYLKDLQLEEQEHKCDDETETPIGLRLQRDKKSLSQMNNHLQAAISHLRGHDWGIFRG